MPVCVYCNVLKRTLQHHAPDHACAKVQRLRHIHARQDCSALGKAVGGESNSAIIGKKKTPVTGERELQR